MCCLCSGYSVNTFQEYNKHHKPINEKSFLSLFSNIFILFSVQLPLTRNSLFVCLIYQIWPSIGIYIFHVLRRCKIRVKARVFY